MMVHSEKNKNPKPASIYRKPVAERVFRKKYLALLEQGKDRALLESSFENQDGSFILKKDLDADTLKRLNVLAKAIKSNRGALKTLPAAAVLLLVAGGAVFVLFFMNPVLERALESGLETAFGARAEATGFRLELHNLRVSIASISVADRDKPMRNLFETGRVELKVNPAALLRGKVYVEEASAATITLGTPREVSGALPGMKESEESAAGDSSSSTDAAALVDFENFDAAALLEREKSRLRAPAAYAEATAAYTEATIRWRDRLEASQKTVEGLKNTTRRILSIDPKSIRSLEEAKSIAEEAKTAAETAKAAADEAKTLASAVQADAEMASGILAAARSSVSRDLEHLTSFIDPKSGAARSLLEPTIREILDDKLERWIYYGQRGLAAAKAVGNKSADEKAEDRRIADAQRGRDVRFPAEALPRFRLGILASSFAANSGSWEVELRELSTDPDLVPEPTTLRIATRGQNAETLAVAVADLRSSAKTPYTVEATATKLPVDLGERLSGVGIGSFTGRADVELRLRGAKDDTLRGNGTVEVREPQAGSPKGIVGRALAESISEVEAVKVSVDYDTSPGADEQFLVKTNLDNIVAEAVSAAAERYAKKAAADLEKALKDYVAKELEGQFVSGQQLDAILAAAKGDAAAAEAIKNAVEKKREELENRGKAIVEEARRQAEAAVKEAADKAKAEAQKAADQAKAEAQKAAAEAAKKAGSAAVDAVKKGDLPKIKF